ncbi:MAG TPA: trehalose-phosphatase, partial [Gemmataceae bacterium]|nr:trehalose-phosphatase [Gemmataceae bacterium]
MNQHLFDAVQEVEQRIINANHVLVCLDYDGTLTHFAANPLGAHLSQQMERVLLSLSEHGHASLAIVSGRDRADLQSRISIPGVFYAGNHGLEISGPGYMFVEPTAAENSNALKELAQQLEAKLASITGAIVENKGLTISVHYRQVAAEQVDEVRSLVHATLAAAKHPFVLSRGEKVFEIRPRVYWNKGNAVGWIQEKIDKPDILAIYVGDDTTDEDAFAALDDGITVKVGEALETAARYKVSGTAEVRKLLEWLDEVLEHKALRQAEACA